MIGALGFDDPSSSLLGPELKVISQPQFQPLGPHGERQIIFPLTVSGSGPLNITCGEFYTVGVSILKIQNTLYHWLFRVLNRRPMSPKS